MTSAALSADVTRPSLSSAAREWIEQLPAGTWFRAAAVPGPKHVAHNVLSRLLAADMPIIGRVAHGIYWRQPPPASRHYGKAPAFTDAADSVLAPPGSSYAGFCALSRLGWSTQVPYRTTIAVPYRNLTPPERPFGPAVRFVERSNERRRDLNWNEANLLEAAKAAAAADYRSWDHAMWLLIEVNGWMKPGDPIRREMLLWASATEPPGRRWPFDGEGDRSFEVIIERLADGLPGQLEVL